MPRVIVIDPDRTGLAAMQAALAQGGFSDVLALTSGSFALTMLERNRPDLIVSRVGVPDIDGYELCSIVRKDPLMTGVLFLLLVSPGDEAAPTMLEGKPDQTLAGDLPLTAIVSEVANLLGRAAQPPVATSEPTAPAAQPDGAHGLAARPASSWSRCRRGAAPSSSTADGSCTRSSSGSSARRPSRPC